MSRRNLLSFRLDVSFQINIEHVLNAQLVTTAQLFQALLSDVHLALFLHLPISHQLIAALYVLLGPIVLISAKLQPLPVLSGTIVYPVAMRSANARKAITVPVVLKFILVQQVLTIFKRERFL